MLVANTGDEQNIDKCQLLPGSSAAPAVDAMHTVMMHLLSSEHYSILHDGHRGMAFHIKTYCSSCESCTAVCTCPETHIELRAPVMVSTPCLPGTHTCTHRLKAVLVTLSSSHNFNDKRNHTPLKFRQASMPKKYTTDCRKCGCTQCAGCSFRSPISINPFHPAIVAAAAVLSRLCGDLPHC